MDIKVYDNFLDVNDFNTINFTMMSINFPWYFNQYKVFEDEVDIDDKNFQFTHTFYKNFSVQSSFFETILPLIMKMEVSSLVRIKANLTTRWNNILEFKPHVDNILPNARTAIFYLNTNNGYTRFTELDKKIDSVANRLVTFPNNALHCGTTHTDTKYRAVININYFGNN